MLLSIENRCYLLPNPLGNKNKGDSKLLHFIHVSMKHEDFLLHITTHQHHQSSESTQQLFDANDDNSVLTPNTTLIKFGNREDVQASFYSKKKTLKGEI